MRDKRVGILSLDDFKKDYDWREAFAICAWKQDYTGHPIESVEEILAQAAGENDEADWMAVVRMGSPFYCYAVVVAGCDYTGWDCQAGGAVETFQSADAACSKLNLTDKQRDRLGEQLRALHGSGRVVLDW